MKNKFFKVMSEELENEKKSKKIDILKTSLFLYMTVISKVLYEELEVLKNSNYLFLEYLNNIGFTYNLKENYLKNMKNLSSKIKIFEDTYKAIESRLNREELIEDAGAMEIDLKLDIFRGQCVKIAKNYIDKIINSAVIPNDNTVQLLSEILGIKNNEILYAINFFEENMFYDYEIPKNEIDAITDILFSIANLKKKEKISIILTKEITSKELIYESIKNNKKGIVEKSAIDSLTLEEKEELVKSDKIQCIISVPFNNVLKNQVVIFNEEKEEKEHILFVQTQDFFEKGNEKIKVENFKELLKILDEKEEVNGVLKSVSNDAVLEKECNFDILNYVFKIKEKINLEELMAEKDESYKIMTEKRERCDKLLRESLEVKK
ncbi:hypothetical protein JCM16775_1160 [Leptotrichia hofstadii]|uniref:DNA methylase adenine-specific domain-containing protein n=1 Tax=Leptotrichia hofstadii TaxID=157688 RepID=A0A510JJA7_9FUSO|nr:hypothetical protein [Leptotrichia hofstadii]BBM38451.1 hypothetical protein JCM16775_1160 [Leptotrichia hofstadii]